MQGSAGETVKPAKPALAKICDNPAGILLHRPVTPAAIAKYCRKNDALRLASDRGR
jgi:hypothetical protein